MNLDNNTDNWSFFSKLLLIFAFPESKERVICHPIIQCLVTSLQYHHQAKVGLHKIAPIRLKFHNIKAFTRWLWLLWTKTVKFNKVQDIESYWRYSDVPIAWKTIKDVEGTVDWIDFERQSFSRFNIDSNVQTQWSVQSIKSALSPQAQSQTERDVSV